MKSLLELVPELRALEKDAAAWWRRIPWRRSDPVHLRARGGAAGPAGLRTGMPTLMAVFATANTAPPGSSRCLHEHELAAIRVGTLHGEDHNADPRITESSTRAPTPLRARSPSSDRPLLPVDFRARHLAAVMSRAITSISPLLPTPQRTSPASAFGRFGGRPSIQHSRRWRCRRPPAGASLAALDAHPAGFRPTV